MIRLQKHIQILVILLALVCVSTNTWANTEEGDLYKAAYDGDLSRVKALIAANADVNAKTGDGITALIYASQNGHQEVVHALIAAKADVNAKANNGATALMAASQKGHKEVVQVLIAAKADVNATAFMRVPQKGHKGMEQTLIIADGVTALMLASQDDYQEVVQLLKKAGAVD
jgi:uncharacterized protein